MYLRSKWWLNSGHWGCAGARTELLCYSDLLPRGPFRYQTKWPPPRPSSWSLNGILHFLSPSSLRITLWVSSSVGSVVCLHLFHPLLSHYMDSVSRVHVLGPSASLFVAGEIRFHVSVSRLGQVWAGEAISGSVDGGSVGSSGCARHEWGQILSWSLSGIYTSETLQGLLTWVQLKHHFREWVKALSGYHRIDLEEWTMNNLMQSHQWASWCL